MIQNLNLGAAPNDKTGTKARVAGQIINANFAYLDGKIDNKNYLEVETGFSLVAQTLTMNANWKWVISGIEYTNPVAVEIVIPLAASGKSRIDLIVCNTSNTFSRIAGEESTFTPVAPGVPENTIFATFFTASDGVIGVPVLPKPKAPVVSVNGMRGEVVLGINDIPDLQSELDSKLDASAYNQHFKGVYLTLADLIAAHPTGVAGDSAQVNEVGSTDVVNYSWDAEESIWVNNGTGGSSAVNTDALPEGSTNLYFTVARFLSNLTAANIKAALGITTLSGSNTGDQDLSGKQDVEINVWRPKILETNTSQQNADLINADINAAKLVNGVVLLPAGNFTSRKINWDPRVFLRGAGKRATTLTSTHVEPLLEYVGNDWYSPIGNIEGLHLRGGVDEFTKIGTTALNIQRVSYFHFKNILIESFAANAVELMGCLIGQFEDINVENCNGGFNAVTASTSSIGMLQSNLVKFNNCSFNTINNWAIKWDSAASIQFNFCDFEYCGMNGNAATGIVKATNFSPAAEGTGLVFNGCWGEFNYGTLFSIQGNAAAKHSFRDSMIQYGTATKALVLNGGSVLIDNSTIPFAFDITSGVVENRTSTIGTVTLAGVSLYKKYQSENLTGTVLDLCNPNGDNYNHTTPSSATSYTFKNKVEGAFVSCVINVATEPTVTGATKITGATFVASTNMEMIVEVKNNAVRYFFLSI